MTASAPASASRNLAAAAGAGSDVEVLVVRRHVGEAVEELEVDVAPPSSSACAATSSLRLYESRRRLPAMPRTLSTSLRLHQ